MARMGHDSARAALIYQHTNQQADRAVAEGLNATLASEAERPDDPDDGAAASARPGELVARGWPVRVDGRLA